MLFRSRHETGLRVTTWGLRLQHEAEPNEVPVRKLKLRPLIGSRISRRSRPEEVLSSQKSRLLPEKGSHDLELR